MTPILILALGALIGWISLILVRKRAGRSQVSYDPYEAYRLNQEVEAQKYERKRNWP